MSKEVHQLVCLRKYINLYVYGSTSICIKRHVYGSTSICMSTEVHQLV